MRSPFRAVLVLAALATTTTLGGCLAGPHQVRRTVDDMDQRQYVDTPRLNGVLWVVPLWPALWAGAFVCDFLVTDPYAFWFGDMWDGRGTGFEHSQPEWTDGRMQSLMLDHTRWTRVVHR